jgi:penicillin-binding protein 1A
MDGRHIFRERHPVVCRQCQTRLAPIDVTALHATEGAAEARAQRSEPENLEQLLAAQDPGGPVDGPEGAPQPGLAGPGLARPGRALDMSSVPAQRVLDERIAYVMNSMLGDVIRRGTGTRARALERGDLAGKTGTTDEAADTWFNGYNPDLVTTVWVGFPDHTPLGAREYGGNTPLPIWIDYMRVALNGTPERHPPQPAGLVSMKIDPRTGDPAPGSDPDAIFEYFLSESAPKASTDDRFDPGQTEEDIKPVEIF